MSIVLSTLQTSSSQREYLTTVAVNFFTAALQGLFLIKTVPNAPNCSFLLLSPTLYIKTIRY